MVLLLIAVFDMLTLSVHGTHGSYIRSRGNGEVDAMLNVLHCILFSLY